MQPEERDYAHLWDILQAARELMEMSRNVDYGGFMDDIKLMRASERSLEIIGEGANKLSKPFTGDHPEIEWRDIIGQRNIIAHEYGRIDYELLYRTIRDDIPELIRQLERLVPNVDKES